MWESFLDSGEEILSGAARIGGFFAEKHSRSKKRKKERLQPRLSRYVFFVTLGIFTHVRFSSVIVSEYLLYC